jgi:hypothetical protein
MIYGAGCSFVNGEYHFAGDVTEERYGLWDLVEKSYMYERVIPQNEPDIGGKKLTLF